MKQASRSFLKFINKLAPEYTKYAIDTVNPMCLINDGIENTEHFLLQCHTHNGQRRDLINAINDVLHSHDILNLPDQALVRIMLYGDKRFSFTQKKKILASTLNFVHASKRFI